MESCKDVSNWEPTFTFGSLLLDRDSLLVYRVLHEALRLTVKRAKDGESSPA